MLIDLHHLKDIEMVILFFGNKNPKKKINSGKVLDSLQFFLAIKNGSWFHVMLTSRNTFVLSLHAEKHCFPVTIVTATLSSEDHSGSRRRERRTNSNRSTRPNARRRSHSILSRRSVTRISKTPILLARTPVSAIYREFGDVISFRI